MGSHTIAGRTRKGRAYYRTSMIEGERFYRLVFVRRVGTSPHGKAVGIFTCDCGSEHTAVLASVRDGRIRSCKCLSEENRDRRFRKHGEGAAGKPSAEYKIWTGLRRRCLCSSDDRYADYGGRGIGVCDRWNDFMLFLQDMGRRPSPELSIDRIDNDDGDYEPGNCRWATDVQQANNARTNVLVEVDGRTITLAEACGGGGTTRYSRVYQRITKLGWPVEKALGR